MADTVPTSGAWQTDPQLQHLLAAWSASHAGPPSRGKGDAEALALRNYVDANRARLGIPDNYTVNPSTGQLYDPNQNQIRDLLLTGGAMAAPVVGPALLGGGGAAAGALPTSSAAMPAAIGPVEGIPIAYSAGATATNAGALGGAVGAAASGGGIGQTALGFLGKNWRDLAGAAGAGIGAISQTQAANRGEEFGGQGLIAALQGQADRDFSNQYIAREQEGRTGREDAWRKLRSAEHVLSPGARPQLAGQYNIAPREATGAERTGASALSQEVMARLQGGNPMPPVTRRDPLDSIDPKLLKAGKVESTLGYLSPILRYLGG